MIFRLVCFTWILFTFFSMTVAVEAKDDLVLNGATIYDGSGSAPIVGFVAIDDGKISAVGEGEPPEASWTIDASGMVVCPGFIDLHTHSDSGVISSTSPSLRELSAARMHHFGHRQLRWWQAAGQAVLRRRRRGRLRDERCSPNPTGNVPTLRGRKRRPSCNRRKSCSKCSRWSTSQCRTGLGGCRRA